MPSPRWSQPAATPLFQALAAAQHAAWSVDESRRRGVFTERFRQLVGAEHVDRHLAAALAIFDAQASAPSGFQDPPANMHFACCPNCQRLNSKKFSQAPNGRVKLNALRDREWLERQLDAGGTAAGIAKQLGCTDDTINIWIDKYGLERTRHRLHDDDVAELHDVGLAPGEISRKLDVAVDNVRRALKRSRGVTQKEGHHYHKKEWWVLRIVDRQMSTNECARAAGIYPHACSYWLKQFGLSEITKGRSCATTGQRHAFKYPVLGDPVALKALMEKHRSYEQVSIAVTGRRTGANNVKTWWLHHFGSPPAWVNVGRPGKRVTHSAREWWTERLDRGDTTWKMAEEAGVQESTARERLRTLGGDLLARGYRNNTAAERAKRSIAAATSWAKPRIVDDAQVAGAA